MSEAGNGAKVASSKRKGKKATDSSSPAPAATPSQLLHPVSVRIPVGNREVWITLLLGYSIFVLVECESELERIKIEIRESSRWLLHLGFCCHDSRNLFMFVEWITALQIVVETGLIGRQANGAVTVTDGETVCQVFFCDNFKP